MPGPGWRKVRCRTGPSRSPIACRRQLSLAVPNTAASRGDDSSACWAARRSTPGLAPSSRPARGCTPSSCVSRSISFTSGVMTSIHPKGRSCGPRHRTSRRHDRAYRHCCRRSDHAVSDNRMDWGWFADVKHATVAKSSSASSEKEKTPSSEFIIVSPLPISCIGPSGS